MKRVRRPIACVLSSLVSVACSSRVPGPQAPGVWWGARILIASLDKPELASYQGRRLDEIARTAGKAPLAALMDLFHADITTGLGIMFMMREDDVRAALRHPLGAMGTTSARRGY